MTLSIVTVTLNADKTSSVKVPFELKDNFKAAFKSAKWSPISKTWTVGTRSHKKALAWAEEANKTIAAMNTQEEQETSEIELENAIKELAQLRAEAQKLAKAKHEMQAVLDELQQAKADIEAAKADNDKEKAEATALANEVQAMLNDVIDVAKIQSVRQIMSRLHGNFTSANRREFEEAQDEIRAEREKLRKLGFESHGLNDLCSINWNRPDRDKVSRCRSILSVYRIET